MITPKLEELIHAGIANYNTFVIGGSSAATIPVRNGSTVIITDFTFYHFSDVGEQYPTNAEWLRGAIHQLEFSSEKSRNHYVMRGEYDEAFDGEAFAGIVRGESHFDTYLLHTSDIKINIARVLSPESWTLVFGAIPAKAGEFPIPLGMSGLPAVQNIDFGNGEQYLPLTNKRSDIPTTNAYRGQFRVNYDASSMLLPPTILNAKGNFSFPIVNIGYVQISKEVGKIAQGTI